MTYRKLLKLWQQYKHKEEMLDEEISPENNYRLLEQLKPDTLVIKVQTDNEVVDFYARTRKNI